MLTLHVEANAWRAHLDQTLAEVGGLVPVAKGNGYGFGLELLAAECQRIGCDTLAVGQLDEVASVTQTFRGNVLVLTPWQPAIDAPIDHDPRLIVTLADRSAVRALRGEKTRVVVELLTSMRRFGLDEEQLAQSLSDIGELNLAGFALHLPIDDGEVPRTEEVSGWLTTLRRHGLSTQTIWVSHVNDADLALLRRRHPETTFRPRIGTRLWLGASGSSAAMYRARGTVLAIHPMRRNQRFGYRQRRARTDGQVIVVSGGTSHGIALSAPRSVRSVTARFKAAAIGSLEASGRSLSPFYVKGKRRWFAEPPHMQVSMLWIPGDLPAPQIGDELEVDVRMTTASFDRLILH